MARAALLGRLTWQIATVVDLRDETATVRTLVLRVPDWPGHDAGQHVDVRLTAPDGYTAVRSYSLASAWTGAAGGAGEVELTVEPVPDGEVSPYLTQNVSPGDRLEIRGPIGGWFVWRPEQTEPIQLVAGGSGIVPLMAMVRARDGSGSSAPFRLLYSVRAPEAVIYRAELERRDGDGVEVTVAYTRVTPPGWTRPPGRVDATLIGEATWPPDRAPTCYVCGPTGFVEAAANLLTAIGHDPARIRTERFGPTGNVRSPSGPTGLSGVEAPT